MINEVMRNTIFLKDYQPPKYLLEWVKINFKLDDKEALVSSVLSFNCAADVASNTPLVLQGQGFELLAVRIDGLALSENEYVTDAETLIIASVPASFTLEIETRLQPQLNTALEGLYRSSGNFCTQCEAQGFRRITYYPDRPDVMARFTTTIEAPKARYPVLLANGNLVKSGELPDGKHFAVWEDPFPKPAYLFALVAGDLGVVRNSFVTSSGREVQLEIYVQHHNLDKCDHAMASLKKAMRWDEEVFGLEYDLDRFMIVAVDDFNMGAMENKGLNIFNSKYILARPETATDDDYDGIEAVVAHEYFHNWTGNRITCRDWFQLSLKEGLTVFRDQQFSGDMGSRAVQRINDVRILRSRQFPEDSGPMAHPIRPDSFIEINNFYTVTVYEKGAEVVRMLHSILGEEGFRRGMDLYVQRHDGQAVTCDDFVAAMADANNIDFSQFKLWYSQAGTPELDITTSYNNKTCEYILNVQQSCPATPGQLDKQPMHIPLAIGLVGSDGNDLPLVLADGSSADRVCQMLPVRKAREEYRFINVSEKPVVSLLRNFSAPVKVNYDYTDQELAFLFSNDQDHFNRWEAGQRLASKVILALVDDFKEGKPLALVASFCDSFRQVLISSLLPDKTFVSQLLTLPSEEYLAEQVEVVDVVAIHAAREFVRRQLAGFMRDELLAAYRDNNGQNPYSYETVAAGQRRLKNCCLSYLVALDEPEFYDLALAQFRESDNMTDAMGGLRPLVHAENNHRQEVLASFYEKWRHDPLVLDKWFALQATAPLPTTLASVRQLLAHPDFSIKNPNKVRALIGAFAGGNPVCFHAADGGGYEFLAEQVLVLDSLNPQVAARMVATLSRWRRYGEVQQGLMRKELQRIIEAPALSNDVYEVVSKSLK